MVDPIKEDPIRDDPIRQDLIMVVQIKAVQIFHVGKMLLGNLPVNLGGSRAENPLLSREDNPQSNLGGEQKERRQASTLQEQKEALIRDFREGRNSLHSPTELSSRYYSGNKTGDIFFR